MRDNDEPGCCEFCGSPVIKSKTIDGARYYLPIDDSIQLDRLFNVEGIDLFIYDRLRRAEKIIEDLRRQLKLKESQ